MKVALLASRPGAMPRESFFEEHAKALASLLDEAAAFSHWETRRIHDAPTCDAATFLWYAPERYDEGRLSAWQSPGERVWRLRVSEHVTHFEQV